LGRFKTISLEGKDSDGNTMLHAAARCGALAIVRLLLEQGAQANCQDVNILIY